MEIGPSDTARKVCDGQSMASPCRQPVKDQRKSQRHHLDGRSERVRCFHSKVRNTSSTLF